MATRQWYSVNTFKDVGGPEDGMIPVFSRILLRATSPELAWEIINRRGRCPTYTFDEEHHPHRDVRLATQDEIEEQIYYMTMDWKFRNYPKGE